MRVKNTTNIPAEIVRDVIRFVRPPGISNFDVMLRNSTGRYVAGRAYTQGSGYHSRAVPFIVCRVPTETLPRWEITREMGGRMRRFTTAERERPIAMKGEKWTRKNVPVYPLMLSPYQRGQLRGKRYYIANRIEHLVYIVAHELRHLWQAKGGSRRRGMAHGARGQFSEIDTESFAIRMLRAWRRHVATAATPAKPQLPNSEADKAAKRAAAARARLLASITKTTASLKRWNTKAKRANTAIKKLNRTLKRLQKKAGQ